MSALLIEILDPRHVSLELKEATAEEAILEIVELLRDNAQVKDYFRLADSVMEREGRSSTNTGDGVAFPHARTSLVEHLVLGIGRSKEGIRFGGPNSLVHLIFLIAVPERMVTDYLVCVGALARVVKDEARRDALMEATTAEDLVEQIRSAALLLE